MWGVDLRVCYVRTFVCRRCGACVFGEGCRCGCCVSLIVGFWWGLRVVHVVFLVDLRAFELDCVLLVQFHPHCIDYYGVLGPRFGGTWLVSLSTMSFPL